MASAVNRAAVMHLCGAAGAVAWGWLAVMTRREGPMPLTSFGCLIAVAWLMLGASWMAARKCDVRHVMVAVWVWAAVWRAIGLWAEPVYEDDWARYLWDGRQFVETGNPYASPPLASFDDPSLDATWSQVLDGINHPDLPTIYPPVCQAVFALSYLAAPAQLWPLKLALIAAELLTLGALVHLVTRKHHLLIYAWCPLLIQESAFSAHPEALWVAAVAAAVSARSRQNLKLAGVCCGLALAAKVFALLVIPFILWRRNWRASLVAGGLCLATAAATYTPFWLQGSAADLPGLRAMAGLWEFNAIVFKWLTYAISPPAAKAICAAVFAALWCAMLWRWRRAPEDAIPRGDVIFGLFFLLSTVINPWYLAGFAFFVCLRPTGWGVAALMAVTLSYAHGLNMMRPDLAPYELAGWVRPLEAGMVLTGYLVGRIGAGSGAG